MVSILAQSSPMKPSSTSLQHSMAAQQTIIPNYDHSRTCHIHCWQDYITTMLKLHHFLPLLYVIPCSFTTPITFHVLCKILWNTTVYMFVKAFIFKRLAFGASHHSENLSMIPYIYQHELVSDANSSETLSIMPHSFMNLSVMPHSFMNISVMPHSFMNYSVMPHSFMKLLFMPHSFMNLSVMPHSFMNLLFMPHSFMNLLFMPHSFINLSVMSFTSMNLSVVALFRDYFSDNRLIKGTVIGLRD